MMISMVIDRSQENGDVKERLARLEASVKVLFWALFWAVGINIVLTVGNMAMTAALLLK